MADPSPMMRRERRLPWEEVLFLCLLLGSLAGLLWTPHPPLAQDFREQAWEGPSLRHWMGVDAMGRDVFSRTWRGAANSVAMGLTATALTLLLAGMLLLAREGLGRPIRRVIDFGVRLWVALPVVMVALVLLVFLNPSPATLCLAAALGNLPFAYRQGRITWKERRRELYVLSSEVLGARGITLWRNALWPAMAPDLLAIVRLLFALSLLELSGLAFLGLAGDPDFPELGALARQHQSYLMQQPSLVLWPGLWLVLLLTSNHLAGRSRQG